MAALVPTVTAVTASTTAVTLMAARPGVRQRIVENTATSATLYLKFGTGAVSTLRTVALGPGDLYELPFIEPTANETFRGPYDGLVSGIWTAVDGSAMVTEVS